MLEELLRADRLAEVIEHTTAPAFLLGAMAAFVAIMLARVENLMRRMTEGKHHSAHDLLQTRRRVRLLQWAIFFSLCAAIVTILLVVVAFVFGFLNLAHEYGMGTLFFVSFGLFIISLALFAEEIRLALKDNDRIS
jgi:ABC-type Fe3+ transport system permease subunit